MTKAHELIKIQKSTWKSMTKKLQITLRTMRTNVRRRIGKAPFEPQFGREPRKEIHNSLGNANRAFDWLKSKLVSAKF